VHSSQGSIEQRLLAFIKQFEEVNSTNLSLFMPRLKDAFTGTQNTQGCTLRNVKKKLLHDGKYKTDIWLFIRDVTDAFQFIFNNFAPRKPIHVAAKEVTILNSKGLISLFKWQHIFLDFRGIQAANERVHEG
jgi:hypothetical protein